MAGALSLSNDATGSVLVLAWAGVVLLLLALLGRMMRARWILSKPITAAVPASGVAVSTARGGATQIDRLLTILDGAIKSGDRAITAHARAARQLDSAEYQLLRLFVEFPVLSAVSTRNAVVVRPIAVWPVLVPQPLAA